MSLRETAFLVANIDKKTLKVVEVGIYSEPTPSMMNWDTLQVTLLKGFGGDYHNGRLEIIKRLKSFEWDWLTSVFPEVFV